MIRESTFAPVTQWTEPTVAEVAAVFALLKDHGYDANQLASVTGLQQKNVNLWTARYRNEPDNISSIPYPCWCFLSALVGRPNIQSGGEAIQVNVRRVLSYFKPTAFRPNDKYVSPTSEQFSHLIDNENYETLTTENLSQIFDWSSKHFTFGITQGSLSFLNWSLIVMNLGIDIQKMILKDLHGDLSVG
ncbi:hypothetical protein [Enterovibrio nigricans]|uniref:Uncharacterized protein n=1 Tax=Enterovibrio nigricans DSM 22720 TaxID=1121868 RepID=A0A1T4V9R9_9GAMM|nr:hypothetical protein [Enterovibrio nigricans]PKF50057.1 hypothetical protein AT251_14415 [Enterovibrio nigricans]SKA61740.1 hypothetical protein SAMN02745132_03525 [Enterovibrio nigricans DSM 22720]